ncbi:GIY-YIG nuclease family protein [Nonomuraea sp. NPDC003707]
MKDLQSLYVIAFDSGVLKVGRSADPVTRLRQHRSDARKHGYMDIAEWFSPPYPKALQHERALLHLCHAEGTLREGREWFSGLDYDYVQRWAQVLSRQPERAARRKTVWQGAAAVAVVAAEVVSSVPRC